MPNADFDAIFARERVKLFKPQRWVLYVVTGSLWITGIVWLVVHYLKPRQHFENQAIELHGLFAMLFLVMAGTMFTHVRRGLAFGVNKLSGISMISVCVIFLGTAWMLYYAGDDVWRSYASVTHSVLGAALPLLLVGHIFLGRRAK